MVTSRRAWPASLRLLYHSWKVGDFQTLRGILVSTFSL